MLKEIRVLNELMERVRLAALNYQIRRQLRELYGTDRELD
jgi:hypothetical protein